MTRAPWHSDPALAGRFHSSYPNDLQVIVHDGEPRRTQRGPEACWVRVFGLRGFLKIPVALGEARPPLRAEQLRFEERPVYEGLLLNQPLRLETIREGERLLFLTAPGIPHPLRVTEAYLAERPSWVLTPCDRCGADQALDPMSIMARTRFPDAPEGTTPVAFSAFCPCGGTMLLCRVEGAVG